MSNNYEDGDFVRIKNSENGMHLANVVAEYSFGNICQDHYDKIKNSQCKQNQDAMNHLEQGFKIAIDLGLTEEMSLNGGSEMEEIWNKVELRIGEYRRIRGYYK